MFSIIGRMCLSLIFILSGVNKIFNWDSSEQFFMNALLDGLSQAYQWDWAQHVINIILPWTSYFFIASVVAEILGGLLVFFSIQLRLGAILLILVLISTTLIFHSFWLLQGEQRDLQQIIFLQNVSIFGGLLVIMGSLKKKEAVHD
jgi:putative oxidoreductase